MNATIWICTAALCTAQPLRAQPEPATRLRSVVELPRLVDLAAERLGLNVEYDSRLTGSVTLRLHGDLDDTDLWALTNRLLAARGFTTVLMAGDETFSVVPLTSAASLTRVEPLAQDTAPPDLHQAGFRAVLIPVRGRGLTSVVAAVEPLLSDSGSVTPIAETQSVLVADLAPRVRAAVLTIESLDADAAATHPVEIPLSNLPADRIITLLAQVSAKRAASGANSLRGELLAGADNRSLLLIAPPGDVSRWRGLIEQLDRQEALRTESYPLLGMNGDAVAESLLRRLDHEDHPRLRVVADDLTGSLIVTGTAEQHARVQGLLSVMATAPEAVRRPTRTFRLKNRDAEEVVGVVRSLIASGIVAARSVDGSTSAAVPRGGTEPAGSRPEPRELQLTADPATNSIIAIGEIAELERLERLLKDLDVRRPQVLLEVLIVSLSESDSLDLGVEIEALINGPNDTVAKLSSLFGLSSTGAGASGIDGNRGAGLTGIVLNPGDFSVVLRALQSLNEGRSLSIPKVLVASNEQASLNSVLEQ
ncbi:MAG: secretin N-terminal domain-containing protein, partial [Phycisphaerales bacterium JB041]